MENAAKALQVAATILIGIMILSVAVYLFASSGRLSGTIYSKIEENDIKNFNEQFLKYDGLETCTAHDIVSISNLAKNNNKEYELTKQDANENTYYIRIIVKEEDGTKTDYFENLEEKDYIDFMNNSIQKAGNPLTGNLESAKLKNYKCEAKVSSVTKRVYLIQFEELT